MTAARSERFAVEQTPTLDVQLPAGHLEVSEGQAGEMTVEVRGPHADSFEVALLGSATVIVRAAERRVRWGSHRVMARVPAGTRLEAKVASADATVTAELSELTAQSASGDLAVGAVGGDCDVKTASGAVRVTSVGGDLSARSASGEVRVAAVAGAARLHAASGALRLERADGDVEARTASGDIDIGRYAGSDLRAQTMSGDVRVGVPAGRDLDVGLRSLSGTIRTPSSVTDDAGPPGPDDGRVEIRTVSGDITIVRAE